MKTILIISIFSMFFISCGGYNTGAVQKTEKGQLRFVGNLSQASFSIDEGDQIVVSKQEVVYQMKPGNHNVKVFRDSKLIVNRSLFFDSNVIMEVEIP